MKTTDISNLVHPQLLAMYKQLPRLDGPIDYLALRQLMAEFQEVYDNKHPLNRPVRVQRIVIPGHGSNPAFPVVVYSPLQVTGNLPGLVWFHGGGFILGDARKEEPFLLKVVEEVNCIVVSVDYRLAPENPFPAALEDGYTTLKWLVNNATELGVDPERLAVAGGSAGGGIAAGLALMTRDRAELKLIFQMPLYATLDDRHITPSSQEFNDTRVWGQEHSVQAWQAYLGENYGREVSAYAAPSRATDLSGLPPAFMLVGQLELLRDENIEYARRLMQAGVPTELHVFPAAFHAFELAAPDAEISRWAIKAQIEALKTGLHCNLSR